MTTPKKESDGSISTAILIIIIMFVLWAMMMVVTGNIPDSWKTKRVQNEETPPCGSVEPEILSQVG